MILDMISLGENPPIHCFNRTYYKRLVSDYSRRFDSLPFVCSFVNDNLLVADESGTVHYKGNVLEAHNNCIFDVAYANNFFYTASGDFTVKMWDLDSQRCVTQFIGHNGSPKSLSICPSDPSILISFRFVC
jgi:WD40 repeat protein